MASHSAQPLDTPLLLDPDWQDLDALLSQLVEVQIACSQNDGTIATFLPPYDRNAMKEWYRERVVEVRSHRRMIIVLFSQDAHSERRLAGFVMLALPFSQTGPFRAPVEKLFVSPDFRQRGIAKRLHDKLEEVALSEGRTLLLLDTQAGSAAESVYPRLGYKEVGRVEDYAFCPLTGKLTEGVFFAKPLAGHSSRVAQAYATGKKHYGTSKSVHSALMAFILSYFC